LDPIVAGYQQVKKNLLKDLMMNFIGLNIVLLKNGRRLIWSTDVLASQGGNAGNSIPPLPNETEHPQN